MPILPRHRDEEDYLPQWRDKPTVAGMYVCVADKENWPSTLLPLTAMEITAEEIARGVPFMTPRVYGPIPQDEEAKKPPDPSEAARMVA